MNQTLTKMAVVQIKKKKKKSERGRGVLGGVCVCEAERKGEREQASIRPDGVVLLWCKEIKSPRAHF